MSATDTNRPQGAERRVHVDVPRVLPREMVTTQHVEPPGDPFEGRDSTSELMRRNVGVLWP